MIFRRCRIKEAFISACVATSLYRDLTIPDHVYSTPSFFIRYRGGRVHRAVVPFLLMLCQTLTINDHRESSIPGTPCIGASDKPQLHAFQLIVHQAIPCGKPAINARSYAKPFLAAMQLPKTQKSPSRLLSDSLCRLCYRRDQRPCTFRLSFSFVYVVLRPTCVPDRVGGSRVR